MSQDLLTNETHATDLRGTLKTANYHPKDGDEIDNIQAGYMYYNDTDDIFYIYDGTSWYGKAATAS